MAFSLVKPGGWAFGEKLLSGHLNTLDADHANAVDGLNGGLYNLAALLHLTGNTVRIDELYVPSIIGNVELDNQLKVDGGALVETFLNVTGPLSVTGDAVIQGFFTTASLFTAESPVIVQDTLTAAGALNCQSVVQFSDSVSFTGNGKLKTRSKVIAATGDQSIVARNWDVVYIPNGVMAAGNNLTIDDTGAEDDMEIRFTTADTTNSVNAVVPSPLQAFALKNATGFYMSWHFKRIAGSWRPIGVAKL